jgi:hypothetical protein
VRIRRGAAGPDPGAASTVQVISSAARTWFQHALLSGAHLFAAEAQEAALLAGVGGRLGRGQQPPAERLGLLGCGLGRHQLVDGLELLQHLLAAARLEVPQRVLLVLGHGLDVQGHRRQQLLLAGGRVADRNVAIVSLASSIGPPGSAGEMATPATRGHAGSGSIPRW